MLDEFMRQLPDTDPEETAEWVEALEELVLNKGYERARRVMGALLHKARLMRVGLPEQVQTPYINTIPSDQEPPFPGDERMELRIRRMIRWNAAAVVVRANNLFAGIGGHLATYASAASLYEVGFNHFFRGKDCDDRGDQVFFQGHAAPGIYARAFLEGQLSVDHLERFRREVEQGKGLSSYPHPRLMPAFWEFPTVSMGLSLITAIHQARFNRYLAARRIKDTGQQRVWCFVGDGEMDEPESLAGLAMATREKLDNLTVVVNCNLQRLDGPVRGNGKIIQELEALFRGAGWNVIKVIWAREWDELLHGDEDGLLVQQMNRTPDGQFQKYAVESGGYVRKHFFGADEQILKMVAHLSDADITRLRRGGHDYRKIYAAYRAAVEHRGEPTVILAKTVKGWVLGDDVASRNAAHQIKKLTEKEMRTFRDRLELPIPDSQLKDAPFYHPGPRSAEVQYMLERRRALGGPLPRRLIQTVRVSTPRSELWDEFNQGTGPNQDVSTTQAFVRVLRRLLEDKDLGRRIVPIIPDEARTFGMDFLFKKVGIYSSAGQLYDPVDSAMLLSYNEQKDGQILEEGITEAGSMAAFTAAGTAYATHGQPMIPFYMFYSMFGFQRTGDQIWAFADARGHGFLIGGTSGRTTLNGEGLQHQDGHSHLVAMTNPCIRAYDPAFHYEVAAIVRDGLRRMVAEGEDIFYYITVHNEAVPMPACPEGVEDGILRGLYRLQASPEGKRHPARLLGSGAIAREVIKAAAILAERYDVGAEIWIATSYQQLHADAVETERWNLHNPQGPRRKPYVTQCLEPGAGPVIAASDYLKALPDTISRWVPGRYTTLGTDGFGRSDTRQALRRYFEVDAPWIVVATLSSLAQLGQIEPHVVQEAIANLGLAAEPALADGAAAGEASDSTTGAGAGAGASASPTPAGPASAPYPGQARALHRVPAAGPAGAGATSGDATAPSATGPGAAATGRRSVPRTAS